MPTTVERPPPHVCSAFGTSPDGLEPLATERGWRSGVVVFRPVIDKAEASWVATTLSRVSVPDVRIAMPARATDGRQIVGGWMAYRDPEGTPTTDPGRIGFDDLMLTSVTLHQAVAGLDRPDFIGRRSDLEAQADRMAWGEQHADLDETKGGRWFEVLAGSAKPVSLPDQIVHGNLYRSVRFAEDAPPTVLDFRPYFRPAEWGSALVAVDAIALGGADGLLLDGWAHLPAWPQMLLRAMLFRLAAHALNPDSHSEALDRLRAAAGVVSEFA
ncbi:MAG: TIGR02569 family protein [Pseudonocardiaceae bacterium]